MEEPESEEEESEATAEAESEEEGEPDDGVDKGVAGDAIPPVSKKPVLVGFIKVLRTAEDSQSQIRVLTAQAGRLARWRPRRAKMIDLISTTVSSRVGPSVPG
jgi:hypothetical protein